MALTVDELREHVTSELSDDALQLLLDAAYEDIDEYAGPEGEVTELLTPGNGVDRIILSRSATEVGAVVEGIVELEADDYDLIGEQTLRRLRTGTNPSLCWRSRVEVTYSPYPTTTRRDTVAIGLVKLSTTYQPGLVSQRLGEWSETYGQGADGDYAKQRAELLASLGASLPLL